MLVDGRLAADRADAIVAAYDFPTGGTIFRFEDQRNTLTGEKDIMDTGWANGLPYWRARSTVVIAFSHEVGGLQLPSNAAARTRSSRGRSSSRRTPRRPARPGSP